MDKFEFSRACFAITERLSGIANVEDAWKFVFPGMISLEIEHSKTMKPILGLRSPLVVQEAILRRFWAHYFKDEITPWVLGGTEVASSFGGKRGMEISLMSEALIASVTDVQAGLTILRDSTLVNETGSKEPAKDPEPSTQHVNIETPVAIGGLSSLQPDPTSDPKPAPIPTVFDVNQPTKPSNKPARLSKTISYSIANPLPSPNTILSWKPSRGSIRGTSAQGGAGPSARPSSMISTSDNSNKSELNKILDKLEELDVQEPKVQFALRDLRFAAGGNALSRDAAIESPALAPQMEPDISSGPTVGSSSAALLAADQVVECPFGLWVDESGKALPCNPGAGPGDIVLPDNMDPKVYLLPILVDLESSLNVVLWFQSKSKQSNYNKIQILRGEARGRPRPAAIDAEFGFRAFNILNKWAHKMRECGEMIPVLEFISQWYALEGRIMGTRKAIRNDIEATAGKVLFPRDIKPISPPLTDKGESTRSGAAETERAQTTGQLSYQASRRRPRNRSRSPPDSRSSTYRHRSPEESNSLRRNPRTDGWDPMDTWTN